MSEAELKQLRWYLRAILKDGFNKRYLEKMKFVKELDLTQDWVFTSECMCDKELFAAILTAIKVATPSYILLDAYRLVGIDDHRVNDPKYNNLYELVKPKVLFLKYGLSNEKLSDHLKQYIASCIDIVTAARRDKGLRTFIFNCGTKESFQELDCKSMNNFMKISFADEGGL